MPNKKLYCKNCGKGNLYLQAGLTLEEIPIERLFFYIDPKLAHITGEWDIRLRCDLCKKPKISFEDMVFLKNKVNSSYTTKISLIKTKGGFNV